MSGIEIGKCLLHPVHACKSAGDVRAIVEDAAEHAVDHAEAFQGRCHRVAILAEKSLEGRCDVGGPEVVSADIRHHIVEHRASDIQNIVKISACLQNGFVMNGKARLGNISR